MPASHFRRVSVLLTAASVGAIAINACREPGPVAAADPQLAAGAHSPSLHSSPPSREAERDIARLRRLTAPFHRFEAAVHAGWTAPIEACLSNPQLGGMGLHYGNPALIDGTVDVMEPELLLYEPQKNGELRFVAVEYIVPFTAWEGDAAPMLYGQSFHRNETFGIWALHVWHERHNSRGMFADWNPKVTCRHAR